MKTYAFVVISRDGRPYLVRRGEFIGLPYAELTGTESVYDILRSALPSFNFLVRPTLRILESTEQFDFENERVKAIFIEVTNISVVCFSDKNGSCEFDRKKEKADVFLEYFESRCGASNAEHAAA